jgi:hypothetical protein
MKNTITKIALLLFSLSFVSCSEETIDDSNIKKMETVNSFVKKSSDLPSNLNNRQSLNGFCFNIKFPIFIHQNEDIVAIYDDLQFNEIIQNNGLDWFIDAVDYPFVATNIVTSESNLGDVPIAFDGSTDNPLSGNIVTSESNLGDVPRVIEIRSQEALLRLLQTCN